MEVELRGRGTPARGTVRVPGDKSLSHRGLLFGALAEGRTALTHLGTGADVRSTRACLTAMGASIEDEGDVVVVEGRGHRALTSPDAPLNCGNSGTTMRLLSGVVSGAGIDATLFGDDSLNKRPMRRVLTPLRAMGAACESTDGFAPLRFSPADLVGVHHKIEVASAQVLSCLLLAGLYARGATAVEMPPGARDHTQRLLAGMGVALEFRDGFAKITPPSSSLAPLGDFEIPGDPSSAAFFAAAAALHRGSEVRLQDVSLNPTRLGFFRAIERMGVEVEQRDVRDLRGEPVGDLVVRRRAALKPITIAHDEVPSLVDELPVLAVLASVAPGVSEIRGAAELRVKESDRIDAMTRGLRTLSVEVEEHDDGWTIGQSSLLGGRVETFDDHRVAMSFAVAALAAREPVIIDGSEWIATSYPTFLADLAKITAFDLREDER